MIRWAKIRHASGDDGRLAPLSEIKRVCTAYRRYGFRISSPRPRATPNARKHFCEPNGKAVSSEPVAREYTRNPRPLPRTLPHDLACCLRASTIVLSVSIFAFGGPCETLDNSQEIESSRPDRHPPPPSPLPPTPPPPPTTSSRACGQTESFKADCASIKRQRPRPGTRLFAVRLLLKVSAAARVHQPASQPACLLAKLCVDAGCLSGQAVKPDLL